MSDFKARIVQEFNELQIKLENLENFVASDRYDKLPEIDRKDIKKQLWHMKEYYDALNRRVSRLCNNG